MSDRMMTLAEARDTIEALAGRGQFAAVTEAARAIVAQAEQIVRPGRAFA